MVFWGGLLNEKKQAGRPDLEIWRWQDTSGNFNGFSSFNGKETSIRTLKSVFSVQKENRALLSCPFLFVCYISPNPSKLCICFKWYDIYNLESLQEPNQGPLFNVPYLSQLEGLYIYWLNMNYIILHLLS